MIKPSDIFLMGSYSTDFKVCTVIMCTDSHKMSVLVTVACIQGTHLT